MNIPKDIAPHYYDDYRDGYRTGYRGEPWTLPMENCIGSEMWQLAAGILGKGPSRLSADHPRSKVYMRGFNDGKAKFNKLKGGVDCLL